MLGGDAVNTRLHGRLWTLSATRRRRCTTGLKGFAVSHPCILAASTLALSLFLSLTEIGVICTRLNVAGNAVYCTDNTQILFNFVRARIQTSDAFSNMKPEPANKFNKRRLRQTIFQSIFPNKFTTTWSIFFHRAGRFEVATLKQR